MDVSRSFIEKISAEYSDGVHFAAPLPSLRTTEAELVQAVLQMLQGYSTSIFYWDNNVKGYRAKTGIYVDHLSHASLEVILNQFTYAGSCLKLVEIIVNRVETSVKLCPPTLRAFTFSVTEWLRKLRGIALNEELKISRSGTTIVPTLIALSNSLSSLCSGAECLLQVVQGAIPEAIFELNHFISAAEIAVFVIDHLYEMLTEACLVQGGEEAAYLMLLHIFVGSMLPYIEVLDYWLYEGTLSDPFEEMFFYANESVSIDAAEFWDKSYFVRTKQDQNTAIIPSMSYVANLVPTALGNNVISGRQSINVPSTTKGKDLTNKELELCPLFLREVAQSIVSAGKSLQLIRHVTSTVPQTSHKHIDGDDVLESIASNLIMEKLYQKKDLGGLTLAEVFFISIVGLIGHGDRVSVFFFLNNFCRKEMMFSLESNLSTVEVGKGDETVPSGSALSGRVWSKLLQETLLEKTDTKMESNGNFTMDVPHLVKKYDEVSPFSQSFVAENPVITVCQKSLRDNRDDWKQLNVSGNSLLPPLNDESLRDAIYNEKDGSSSASRGTDFAFGFGFVESEYSCRQGDSNLLEGLFPFPTIVPPFKDDIHVSNFLPFQNNSTLASKVLLWIQSFELKFTHLPVNIVQECLIVFITKQVELTGTHILRKLMSDWRLMNELGVLRAIYLLGSGDLLQHFLTIIFNRLDKGEECDNEFELNTILQESIRNSADGMLLSAPDSLVVSISGGSNPINEEKSVSTPRKIVEPRFGIDGLNSLKFAYKVPWPLELIANSETIKKYNQVMNFLLKVKRAKFVLDKARRWMWKGRGASTVHRKHHWLLEQKLLHFVDAFHQYVMDRVYHSAWRELCEGMAAAGSLDQVLEVHDAYLLSIQRQCFIVPDKLWALIASRINSILSLALDFYTIQQTLRSGGAVSAVKARCELEVDRIGKSFDDCIAFLLRVLSFKLNVSHFPHLADLVTRINYNYFYMSDSVAMTTAPGSETVAPRPRKTLLP